jgi:hypothetical protein
MALVIPDALKPVVTFAHPATMWVLLALTLYAGYLGWQSRRTRTATGEEKKTLVKGKFATKHFQVGSLVLAIMVLGSLGGMAATYINNQKLFVGPHLLAGLAMTGTIAASAALAPAMQKGNDLARYAHIGLNTVIVGLFGWQAVSGLEIVQKILSNP